MEKREKFTNKRYSGVLMHISSLPGPYGIGSFGRAARDFGKFLYASGQKYWQVLPLGPTGFGDSPYQSFSSFAGNPYFIDLDSLLEAGLLREEDLAFHKEGWKPNKVDYSRLSRERLGILKMAFENFSKTCAYQDFVKENSFWLEDYSLFMAIKETRDQKPWYQWEPGLKFRQTQALENFIKANSQLIEFYSFVQFLFFSQLWDLKKYLKTLDIDLIGDLPFYVAMDSADAWAHPEIFHFDENLDPIYVAGVPPDYFSQTGQLWGNPIYKWDFLKETAYKWWIDRIGYSLKIYDLLRIDHFRGFESFWQIPFGQDTAINGTWVKGPAMDFFQQVEKDLGQVGLIAEDLGLLTKEVEDFVRETAFPTMKVLEFSYDPQGSNKYLPHNCEKNSVSYIGTHDNTTLRAWYEGASQEEKDFFKDYFNLRTEENLNWQLIRGLLTGPSKLAIIQAQDLLNLGATARMNTPGSLGDNWTWRMEEGALTEAIAEKLRRLSQVSGRHNNLFFA
ncbi:MAG: 4-alpha-glucanotransferase [Bacillota bacterium]|nr:4-alpha-glucanotransferase [Bacillota bacterium]